VRATTLLRNFLGMEQIRVLGFEYCSKGIIIDAAPTTRVVRCSGCGRKTPRVHDRNRGRTWRHLDMAGMMVYLRYGIRRGRCDHCGVRVEQVPWAATGSTFTYSFEDQVGYLVQHVSKSAVAQLMRIAWATVGDIVQRVVERNSPKDRLSGLRIIGIDELCFRSNEYITVITDHFRHGVVWVGEGKNSETLRKFFESLGPERCAQIEAVTLDMSAAFIKGVRDAVPHAQLIFDRFHVQRLAHDALDEVRREQKRNTETRLEVEDAVDEETRFVKNARWALQKNPWNLRQSEREKLSEVQRHNKPLYRAYLLKETLLSVLDREWPSPRLRLEEWLGWASRSRLAPFVRLAKTIRKYTDGILAYVRSGLTNARNEGINGKIRSITKRAFGFRSRENLIGLIFLCCSGIHLEPVFHYPRIH
jgi:transposase